jgi:hypothetical protein
MILTLDTFSRFIKDYYIIKNKKFGSEEEKEILTKYLWRKLNTYSTETLQKAMDSACEKSKYFPDIKDIIDEIGYVSSSEHIEQNTDYSWFHFLMTTSVENAKYYRHKLNDYEAKAVLKRMRENGVPDFVPLENCEGFRRFQEYIKQIDRSPNNFGEIRNIRYDPDICSNNKALNNTEMEIG